jgi:predicted nuclease of restriction endonuclease-like (RecB) superfamily
VGAPRRPDGEGGRPVGAPLVHGRDARWRLERDVLAMAIESDAYRRRGGAVTNFGRILPAPQSDLARQTFKDPYIFDFVTLDEPFHERELETSLVRHLENFLLELGQGFAFVGRQYRIEVDGRDFYIDLLFYHLKLRAFIVIELLCCRQHNSSYVA